MEMSNEQPITVCFGGEAREVWTGDGLRIAWSGRLRVLALRDDGDRWTAAAPEPPRGATSNRTTTPLPESGNLPRS